MFNRKTAYFENILNTTHCGILVFDEKGKLLLSNHFFDKMFFPSESKRKIHFQDIFRIKNTKKYYIFNFEKFIGKREYHFILCNEQATPVACRFGKIENPRLKTKEIVVSFTDLTESKKMARQNRKLQSAVVRDAFRAGMAENAIEVLHNIGNILAAIIGNTSQNTNLDDFMDIIELLLKIDVEEVDVYELVSALKEELVGVAKGFKRDFDFVTEKAGHIANLIATQQRYANLNQEIKTSVNLSRLIGECLQMYEAQILKNNIEIVHHNSKDIHIFVEENGMIQVLANIIVNASESVQEVVAREAKGGARTRGRIEIRSWVEGDMAVLQVVDNGTGLGKENAEKVFDYGFSTKNRSSGVGLYSCLEFIKRFKGSINIANNAKEGANVVLKLPLYREERQKVPKYA